MFRIGCHLSSAGGYLAMGQTAVSIGANVFQFFTRNPRGGAARPLDRADVRAFGAFAAEHGLGPILAHAPYTLNAAGAEERVRAFAESTIGAGVPPPRSAANRGASSVADIATSPRSSRSSRT